MQELIERRNNLENELKLLEKQIYDLETHYLEDTQNTGNVIIGWSSYLTNKSKIPINTGFKKQKCNNNDRLFSLSSTTSPAMRDFQEDIERNLLTGTAAFMAKRNKKKKNYAKIHESSTGKGKRDESYSGKKNDDTYDDDANTVNSEHSRSNSKILKKKDKVPGIAKKGAKIAKQKSKKAKGT